MKPTDKKIIHQGNSVITTEIHPDYSQPVVIKKPSNKDSSGWNFRSLEREYEMTRSLDSVEGVRKALGKQQTEGQQVLILEYIDGETPQDLISRNILGIRSKLEIAIDLARILGKIHQQNIIHLNINSKNILIGKKRRDWLYWDYGFHFRIIK